MKRVVLLGDYMLDRWFVVREDGVSAEAPIPRHRVMDIREFPGGAGNVAANLRELGVCVYGFPGDSNRACWRGSIYREGTRTENVKNRMVCGDRQIARWDENDVSPPIIPDDRLAEALGFADAVVVADYGKGAIWQPVVDAIRDTDLPVFVDTKGNPSVWNFGDRVTFFPNKKEYAQWFMPYQQCARVVYKQGAQGMEYILNGETIDACRTVAPQVVSVAGAGDTVMAAFAASVLAGRRYIDALEDASRAAAVVVQKPFTATASWHEIWPDRRTQ